MASDVYNRCEGQIQHPETQSSILCWGALLAYIDCIRLHNGLELLNAPDGFFEGGSNAHRNEVSQTPALYKLLHSKNAVPDHGIAFYVLTKYFDDFVVITNPYMPNGKQKINLSDEYYQNRSIKIYALKKDDGTYTTDVHSANQSISTFTVFENGQYMKGDNFTNYFRINDVERYNDLSVFGWQQLREVTQIL